MLTTAFVVLVLTVIIAVWGLIEAKERADVNILRVLLVVAATVGAIGVGRAIGWW